MASGHPDTHDPSRTVSQYHTSLDAGCHALGLGGGMLMWRVLKALSQLLVIIAAFLMYAQSAITAQAALTVMVVTYLGAEGVETLIAARGKQALVDALQREDSISISVDSSDDESDEERTDGGATITETREERE